MKAKYILIVMKTKRPIKNSVGFCCFTQPVCLKKL